MRNVDQVIVKTLPNGQLLAGVLIDQTSDPANSRNLLLNYSEASNGDFIFSLNRDFDMNDLSVLTKEHGTVAITSTAMTTDGLRTVYRVRGDWACPK